jgi:hypothetical protein
MKAPRQIAQARAQLAQSAPQGALHGAGRQFHGRSDIVDAHFLVEPQQNRLALAIVQHLAQRPG